MALFLNKKQVIICTNDNFLVYNTESETTKKIHIPDIIIAPNLTNNQKEALRNEKCVIVSCSFSQNGEYFAVTTSNKQLVIYDKHFNVIKNYNVNRAASKVRFTFSGDVLIADKAGDVYLYKMSECEPVQILGHLSMILDVLTTKNDKYVITCDRDEKIRVSYFPNSYNIVCYCLGHEEFVLNLELYNSDVLISASGDGSLIFWKYLNGEKICVVNVNDYVKDKSLVKKISKNVEINNLPVTQMKVCHFDNFVLIVCSLYSCKSLLIFKAIGEIEISLLQTLEFNSDIKSFDFSQHLYVLTDEILCYYYFKDLFVKFDSKINDFCKDIEFINEDISVFYKKKFDNVQEYHERKKLRIENKNK